MQKKAIAEFFDHCAPWWDADLIRNEDHITAILNNAGIRPGVEVLDVACGTGVLFQDYVNRDVHSVTGIDIAPEMVKIAASKFPRINVICGDVETTDFEKQFDCVMVYNAFPHFPDPEALIRRLAKLTKPGGRLSVAHGMSRAQLQQHHAGRAAEVSIDLISERELAKIFDKWFDVDVIISTDRMYQVCGSRRLEDGRSAPASKGDLPDPSADELVALLRFMVSHNDAHAQELAELADQLSALGKTRASRSLMNAIADFDAANAQLTGVLTELNDL